MPTSTETPTPAVAIVASAGGLAAISRVLAGLPDDLGAAVIVVMHLLPEHRSMLAQLLGRHTDLHVKTAETGDEIRPGWVYVGPPDVHVLVNGEGQLRLDTGPPLRHLRPSADRLLDSLANDYDGRCLAVILTGAGSDGASGALAVKTAGGRVVVQDPESSEYGGMPAAAIATGAADSVTSLEKIASVIREFAANRN